MWEEGVPPRSAVGRRGDLQSRHAVHRRELSIYDQLPPRPYVFHPERKDLPY